jgi:hypothetical protein
MRKARLVNEDGETFWFAEPEPNSNLWLGLDREPHPGDEDTVRSIAAGTNKEGKRTQPMLVATRYFSFYPEREFTIMEEL